MNCATLSRPRINPFTAASHEDVVKPTAKDVAGPGVLSTGPGGRNVKRNLKTAQIDAAADCLSDSSKTDEEAKASRKPAAALKKARGATHTNSEPLAAGKLPPTPPPDSILSFAVHTQYLKSVLFSFYPLYT